MASSSRLDERAPVFAISVAAELTQSSAYKQFL